MDDPLVSPDHESSETTAIQPIFRREGEYWTIVFAGTTCRLRDSAGLRYVAHLLGRPGQRIAALDLVFADCPPSTAQSSTPTDDPRAPERARVRVTHAIRHTLQRIAEHHADLNEHLRATIKTGATCGYLPDPRKPVRWELGGE